MSKELSSTQRKIVGRYYENLDTIALDRLGQIISDIYLTQNPIKLEKLWHSVESALSKVGANPVEVQKIVTERNLEDLALLVNKLTVSGGTVPTKPAMSSETRQPSVEKPSDAAIQEAKAASSPTAEELKMALKAFRKRLKLTRLDEESRLGRSPLSTGQKVDGLAIEPPKQYASAIWEALADQGMLKRAGRGLYRLGPAAP